MRDIEGRMLFALWRLRVKRCLGNEARTDASVTSLYRGYRGDLAAATRNDYDTAQHRRMQQTCW